MKHGSKGKASALNSCARMRSSSKGKAVASKPSAKSYGSRKQWLYQKLPTDLPSSVKGQG